MRILFDFLIIRSPPDYVLSKTADFSHYQKNLYKGEIEGNFLNTTFGGLKLNHYLAQ